MPTPAGATIYRKFTTRAFSTGIATTLSGSPVVSVYKDASTTESTAGVSLTVDFDSRTGLNHITIDLSADGTFYSNGSHFEVVITTGTVGGVSAVGYVVWDFDLAAALTTANVTQWNGTNVATPATAGIPDVNVKNINNVAAATPGAAGGVFIAGTNAATTVTTSFTTTFTGNLTGSVGSVTGAVGSVTGAVGSVTGLTTATIATAVWTDTTAGDFTTLTSPGKIIFAQLGGAFTTTSSSVFSTASLANAPTGGSAPTVSQIATAVWQDATAGDFTTAGSIGKSLFTSGAVPGAVGGLFIAGTNAATTITTGLTAHIIGTVDTLTTYTGNTPQTGDSFARIGATGSGLTSLAPSSTALSTAQWTNSLATNLGTLASHDPGTTIGTSTYAGGAVASVTGNVGGNVVGSVGSLTLTQTLSAARALDAIADTSLTLNDALHCAIAGTAGQKDASSGTTMTVKTPSTATLLRTYTITTATAPSTVPTKIA